MIKREIKEKFINLVKTRKIIYLSGVKGVGKSTFVKSIKEDDREYITLDDRTLRDLAKNDPKLFMMSHPGKIIIDEAQYAPELFSYIKMDVDNSNEKGKIWLTGSQKFQLMKNVSESLAGRISLLEMSSLSYGEKKGKSSHEIDPANLKNNYIIDPNDIFNNIFMGGMPEYIVDNLDRNQFFSDYINTYLERDVRDLADVGDLNRFHRFMIALASRTGEVLNYGSLAEDADIDYRTAQKWLSILEASDIIYLLKPYSTNKLNRAIKSPKIYFLDTGLCAYLCGWSSQITLENASTSGHFLETFIVSEVVKNMRNHMRKLNYDIYYYRDKDQKEIDLIFEVDNTVYPFEIKKSANPKLSMLNNFSVLENKNINIGGGGLLCFYPDIIPLNEKYKSYPITVML